MTQHPSVTRQDLLLENAKAEVDNVREAVEKAITACVMAEAGAFAWVLNAALIVLGKHESDPVRVRSRDGRRTDYLSREIATMHRINGNRSLNEVSADATRVWYETFIAPKLEQLPVSELVELNVFKALEIDKLKREKRGEQ
jgi:hypothetical protein